MIKVNSLSYTGTVLGCLVLSWGVLGCPMVSCGVLWRPVVIRRTRLQQFQEKVLRDPEKSSARIRVNSARGSGSYYFVLLEVSPTNVGNLCNSETEPEVYLPS